MFVNYKSIIENTKFNNLKIEEITIIVRILLFMLCNYSIDLSSLRFPKREVKQTIVNYR